MRSRQAVYYGSTESVELDPEYSFIGKLDDIISKLGMQEVKDKKVVVKVHIGNKIGFHNTHPFIVGYIVRKIKSFGGMPYIIDVPEDCEAAHLRGYTPEVLGCPIYPVAGIRDCYVVSKTVNYDRMKELLMGGFVKDAEVLVDLSHIKGHNAGGFGGAIKNLGLGCYAQKTRWKMHSMTQYPPYWAKEKCRDAEKLVASCPYKNAMKFEKGRLKIYHNFCNQCMRCIEADSDGCLRIDRRNFESFFEIMSLATKSVLEYFEPENRFFINFAMDMTTFCDCWGFTQGNMLPDLGILGSKDILAIDKATLDLTKNLRLIRENVPKNLDIIDNADLHPFARVHGPYKDPYFQIYFGNKYALGETNYELIEVKPAFSKRLLPRPKFPEAPKLF